MAFVCFNACNCYEKVLKRDQCIADGCVTSLNYTCWNLKMDIYLNENAARTSDLRQFC